jgi:hypothetical protein
MKSTKVFSVLIALSSLMIVLFGGCRKANFDKTYIAQNDGKVHVEVPEIKELSMIVMALTDYADKDKYEMFYKKSDYYTEVMAHFGKYKNERIVKRFNKYLKFNAISFVVFNSETFCYEFDENNKIRKKKNHKSEFINGINLVSPFIKNLQTFADKTNFKAFYKAHQPFYDNQSRFFTDTIDFPKMVNWLKQNYPDVQKNTYRIIFSPLVDGTQSMSFADNNGFFEQHMHINYPYLDATQKSDDIGRGSLLFTELNHGFENPEAEKKVNAKKIKKAFADINKWQDKNNPNKSFYKGQLSVFEEYINWSLVSLWYWDNLSDKDFAERRIKRMAEHEVKNRGFTKFVEFSGELLRLYKEKKPTETIASLYPQLLDWCEKQ